MLMRLVTIVTVSIFSLSCSRGVDSNESTSVDANDAFDAVLAVDDSRIITLHSLKYRISASNNFSVVGPKHRRDIFNGVPFEISLAAFINDNAAVMVHAERVSDGSGASNYDNLPVALWPDDNFRSEGVQCLTVERADTEGEHDLEWLISNGYDPIGSLLFAQFFASSNDYNDEIVISILAHVTQCDSERSFEEDIRAIQSQLLISPVTE